MVFHSSPHLRDRSCGLVDIFDGPAKGEIILGGWLDGWMSNLEEVRPSRKGGQGGCHQESGPESFRIVASHDSRSQKRLYL